MPKKNAMLERIELKYKKHYEDLYMGNIRTVCQMAQDSAMIAAHDVLGMGAGRCEAFAVALRENINDMAKIINNDEDTDKVYSLHKIEQKLQSICGDKYEPFEVRYEKGVI